MTAELSEVETNLENLEIKFDQMQTGYQELVTELNNLTREQ